MRRKDRETTDAARIDEVIRACDCCRVGFAEADGAYIVPLNFGYQSKNEARTFYFHCAKEGKKLDLLRQNPNVGFELDTNHAVNSGEKACEYSFRFESVMGKGSLMIVEEMPEKKEALRLIMSRYSDRSDWEFTDAEANGVAILRLDVRELACKEHR